MVTSVHFILDVRSTYRDTFMLDIESGFNLSVCMLLLVLLSILGLLTVTTISKVRSNGGSLPAKVVAVNNVKLALRL